ncbi:N-acetylmannosamine-6-phosphate 2-epimerase [Marinilactibacillus psychrotolerans]|uniref:N-acetylmannosamine-6-phosphate 2-epimerase n=1 Tax=Marinilactibacillus psychrotolerans TaxID=191770 RepID=UPI003884E26B
MKNQFLPKVKKELIVSCQALTDEPLHSSFIMSRMALAAEQAGAKGIRANSVEDIIAIKQVVNLPIIGIIKKEYPDTEVYITPTIEEVRAVCETGVEVVALDATTRTRPGNMKLSEIVNTIKKEYPQILLMADTSNLDEVELANELGFDMVGTTLYGYTKETEGANVSDNNFEYLKRVIETSRIPVIAEGKVDTPKKANIVLQLGAHAVVVGGAITRPKQIAEGFVRAIK